MIQQSQCFIPLCLFQSGVNYTGDSYILYSFPPFFQSSILQASQLEDSNQSENLQQSNNSATKKLTVTNQRTYQSRKTYCNQRTSNSHSITDIMARDRPIPGRHPRERRGARRPHTSPTPAPENVSAGPSQTFHTPPPISACDPADEFRPLYCPHCQKLISTNQTYGYLCPWCFVSLSFWRQDMFVRAAYGFCLGSCNGMLSDEEPLAQQCMCSNCAGGHESNLRDYVSIDFNTSVPNTHFMM